ncbi:MAG: MerR family DNA-binding transcriptional regulator [Actinomycetota bacterium]|nr:MerR family DNA-binding transcriptional regulator [Actinomycetota bacterium]
MPDRAYLSIGEVLALLRPEFPDLTISKIRFLESQGLLDPERTPSGYRKFYDPDVERLRWILRQQREQYLPLKVIKGRLGVDDLENGDEVEDAGPAVAQVATEARPSDGAAPQMLASRPAPPVPSPVADLVNPLQVVHTGVSMNVEELSAACGLSVVEIGELERYGLLTGRPVGGTVYFDEEALIVANLAAGFMRFGVEPHHLRMYKTAAEREAGFFEQLVMPMLKQRNPRARRQAIDTLVELSKLGQGLRAAMLRVALKDHTGN